MAPSAAQGLLDAVDDGADLALVGGRDDQEDVGDGELFGDVEGDDLGAELVGGGLCGDARQLERVLGGGHGVFLIVRACYARGAGSTCQECQARPTRPGSRQVEPALGDVLDHAVGHEVPDRLVFGDPEPAGRR